MFANAVVIARAAVATALLAGLTSCAVGPIPGLLRVGLSSPPTCADPRQAGTIQTVTVTRQVVDSLVDQDPATGRIVGWLARGWNVSSDGRQFVFHLRPGVTFSDGSSVTADVVRANFDDLAHTATSATALLASGFLDGYRETEIVDPLTARVTFERPNAQFLQAASTTQLGILGSATLARPPGERCLAKNVVGSGPFRYDAWQQGRSADLTARSDYAWGSEVTGSGRANSEHLRFTVVPESGVRAGSVIAGQLDVANDSQPEDRAMLASVGGRTIARTNPGLPFILQPNFERPIPADAAIRRAVSIALDRRSIVETVLGPDFHPATGVLSSTTPDALSYLGQADVQAASTLLDHQGWRRGEDGLRQRGGRPLRFSVNFSLEFPASQFILELMQQQLRAMGVGLDIVKLTSADFASRRNSGDFDFVYYNITRGDPDILRARLGRDGTNYGHRPFDPAFDPLLTEQLASAEPRRSAIVTAVQQRVAELSLVIPLIELSQVVALSPTVRDVAFDASAVLRLHDARMVASS